MYETGYNEINIWFYASPKNKEANLLEISFQKEMLSTLLGPN